MQPLGYVGVEQEAYATDGYSFRQKAYISAIRSKCSHIDSPATGDELYACMHCIAGRAMLARDRHKASKSKLGQD